MSCPECNGETHDSQGPCVTCGASGRVLKPGARIVAVALTDDQVHHLVDFTHRVGDLEPVLPVITRLTAATEEAP